MAEVRGMRKTRTGVVVSDKMDKTIAIGEWVCTIAFTRLSAR